MSDNSESLPQNTAALNLRDANADFTYGAVIRAYEYSELLAEVISKLQSQTFPPAEIIIVDSSREEKHTQALAELNTTIARYPKEDFNYSKAINIGVAVNPHPYTMIISSHMKICDEEMVELTLEEAKISNTEVIYWCSLYSDIANDRRVVNVNKSYFNGRNGISNSLSFIPTKLLKDRPFREEVFSAEDQEWTKYYLTTFNKPIMRIETKQVEYANPNHGDIVWNPKKLMNEELAIGHFVNRRLIGPDKILIRFFRGVLAKIRRRPDRAKLHFGYAKAMLSANFKTPKVNSKYF